MPVNPKQSVVILDEADEITLADLTRACSVHADWVMELVEEGVIEPRGKGGPQWRFAATTVVRVQKARRLHGDLGINLPGVALALQLLDRIEALEARMRAASQRPDPDEAD
jgi:chaperone modulatory protein CbpM